VEKGHQGVWAWPESTSWQLVLRERVRSTLFFGIAAALGSTLAYDSCYDVPTRLFMNRMWKECYQELRMLLLDPLHRLIGDSWSFLHMGHYSHNFPRHRCVRIFSARNSFAGDQNFNYYNSYKAGRGPLGFRACSSSFRELLSIHKFWLVSAGFCTHPTTWIYDPAPGSRDGHSSTNYSLNSRG
jgi:hypothetical protein